MEVTMKKQKEKNLRLGKVTVRNLEVLDSDAQQKAKAGQDNEPMLNTLMPVFCMG
jgi:hypothetical protein